VKQIALIRQRLLDANGVPDVLAAGWEAFELVGTMASASAGQSADMYPAFTFARGSAVNGRNAMAFAPSMPAVPAEPEDSLPLSEADVYEIADALAGLASTLSMRLREAAELAADAADRTACENAACEAQRINGLLARGSN
jgi:hypothetical protein